MKTILIGVAMALACGVSAPGVETPIQAATNVFETPTMPVNPPENWLTYHLVHPGPGNAHPADPNCAFDWKGVYHLHYIYANDGYNFAHVSSPDLVHWKWHPTVLTPATMGHGMFSGTGFVTKDGKAAIIYHGYGSGRNQIAFALDDTLDKWTRPEPIQLKDKDGKLVGMRHWDPDCWLMGDTYYALSGGNLPRFMKSTDLKEWQNLVTLFHDAYPGTLGVEKNEDISCANMFKIGKKWMLLCISHRLGCRYYLGDFKDEHYLPEFHALMSWNGKEVFAPESLLTRDGRRVMWVWYYGLPITPSGVQSLPRELELPDDGVLRIRPLRELQMLRADPKELTAITVKSGASEALEGISGNTLELELTCDSTAATEFGLDVLCDKNGKNGMRIALNAESGTLCVGKVQAPFRLKPGEDLTLRIFIDKNLVEVFANDRQAAAAASRYNAQNLGIRLLGKSKDVTIRKLTAWKMKTIYEGDCRYAKP
jgi:sucrose-6-phosphate hydrolase SacC (GH32 family)